MHSGLRRAITASRRERQAGRHGAFSLIEMLVVIAVIALLVSIVLPALAAARTHSRLLLCGANIRSQTQLVLSYASVSRDALPPFFTYWNRLEDDGTYSTGYWSLARFMALWEDQPFPQVGDFNPPTGAWRCPEIAPEQDGQHTTHLVLAHSAANTWVYNNAVVDDQTGEKDIGAASMPGWEAVTSQGWRNLSRFGRPADIMAIGDAVTFFFALHGHRHAYDNYGRASQLITGGDNDVRGTHPGSRLPAAFLDGHGAILPMTSAYWNNGNHSYPAPGNTLSPTILTNRESEQLVWFVR